MASSFAPTTNSILFGKSLTDDGDEEFDPEGLLFVAMFVSSWLLVMFDTTNVLNSKKTQPTTSYHDTDYFTGFLEIPHIVRTKKWQQSEENQINIYYL